MSDTGNGTGDRRTLTQLLQEMTPKRSIEDSIEIARMQLAELLADSQRRMGDRNPDGAHAALLGASSLRQSLSRTMDAMRDAAVASCCDIIEHAQGLHGEQQLDLDNERQALAALMGLPVEDVQRIEAQLPGPRNMTGKSFLEMLLRESNLIEARPPSRANPWLHERKPSGMTQESTIAVRLACGRNSNIENNLKSPMEELTENKRAEVVSHLKDFRRRMRDGRPDGAHAALSGALSYRESLSRNLHTLKREVIASCCQIIVEVDRQATQLIIGNARDVEGKLRVSQRVKMIDDERRVLADLTGLSVETLKSIQKAAANDNGALTDQAFLKSVLQESRKAAADHAPGSSPER